jgi:uncharacterized protein (TIGR02001 family)
MPRKSCYSGPAFVAGVALYAAVGGPQNAAAAEKWQFGVVVASDYVHRGLSHNDSRPALQAGVTYQFGQGVYAGVWGATVSNARTPFPKSAGRLEMNYLIGYTRALGAAWDLDLVLHRYDYPDSDALVDYGYTELAASVGYDGRLRLTMAASRDSTIYTRSGLARDFTTYAWELAGQHPLGSRLTGLAGIGYLDFHNAPDTGYAYFNAGLAARVAKLDLELQYIDTSNGERLFGRRLAGPRIVLALVGRF